MESEGELNMGWARFDDGYMFHPKIVEAGPWAELLDRRAIEHCAKNETDGLVTRSALKLLGRNIPKVAERVTVLLEVGRWTANSAGGGWWVHDYLKYNPSKAEKELQREQGRERVRKHRSNGGGNAYQPKGRGGDTEEKKGEADNDPKTQAPWTKFGMTRAEWLAQSERNEGQTA